MTIQNIINEITRANDGRIALTARSTADPIIVEALRRLAEACGMTGMQASEARPTELMSIYNVAVRDASHAPAVAARVLQSIGKRRPDLMPDARTVVPATGPAIAVPSPVDLTPLQRDIDALRKALAAQEAELQALRDKAPTRLEIVQPDKPPVTVDGAHPMLPDILTILTSGDNVWLYGPAGSGKTTLGEHAAKALGLPFYAVSSVQDTAELTGFKSLTTGEYIETAFRRCFQFGGVFLFDEIDNSKTPAITAFNMALAQGYFAFPDGIIVKHKDCHLMAGANTTGNGSNAKYQRNKMDGAALDRFAFIPIDYDEAMEMRAAPNKDWCALVQKIRAICIDEGIDAIISPRATFAGGRAVNAGMPIDRVLQYRIFKGMPETSVNTIKGLI